MDKRLWKVIETKFPVEITEIRILLGSKLITKNQVKEMILT